MFDGVEIFNGEASSGHEVLDETKGMQQASLETPEESMLKEAAMPMEAQGTKFCPMNYGFRIACAVMLRHLHCMSLTFFATIL